MSLMLLGILNQQAAGGGAGAFDLLETVSLATSASSVTFSGLDAYTDYKHLQIRAVARNTTTYDESVNLRLNADSGSNYAYHSLRGSSASVTSSAASSQTSARISAFTGTDQGVNIYAFLVLDILDYANSSKNSTMRVFTGRGKSSGMEDVKLNSGLWMNTSAVTTIEIFPNSGNINTGSRFSLYGIKG